MKANERQIRAAMTRPTGAIRLFLLHGPDEAGAADLARLVATAMGADAERIDLDGATLKNDPARLVDEAASMSLFGGARHIRVTGVGEESLAALTGLLAASRGDCPVVAIAPSLRATAKVVKLALDTPAALVFACYPPSGEDSERLATALAGEHGLRLAAGVAGRLADGCGGDRAVLAREIEKLALYVDADRDRPRDLDHAALDAVGADVGEAEATRAVEAVVDGSVDALGTELALLTDSGVSPIAWLRQLARRLVALAEMRAAIDGGERVDAVMKRHRVFFKDEAHTARALARWNGPLLMRALDRVRAAERATMAPGNAGPVVAEAAAITIGAAAARRR